MSTALLAVAEPTRRLAITVAEPTNDGVLGAYEKISQLPRLSSVEFLVELRLDAFDYSQEEPDIALLLKRAPVFEGFSLPVMATFRHKSEGGIYQASDDIRAIFLESADYHGASHIDFELLHPLQVKKGNALRIISYHNPNETPANIEEICQAAFDNGADIAKVVTTSHSEYDNSRMLSLVSKFSSSGKSVIGFCMGEIGKPTRALTLQRGGYLSFVLLPGAIPVAPSMLPLPDFVNYAASIGVQLTH